MIPYPVSTHSKNACDQRHRRPSDMCARVRQRAKTSRICVSMATTRTTTQIGGPIHSSRMVGRYRGTTLCPCTTTKSSIHAPPGAPCLPRSARIVRDRRTIKHAHHSPISHMAAQVQVSPAPLDPCEAHDIITARALPADGPRCVPRRRRRRRSVPASRTQRGKYRGTRCGR